MYLFASVQLISNHLGLQPLSAPVVLSWFTCLLGVRVGLLVSRLSRHLVLDSSAAKFSMPTVSRRYHGVAVRLNRSHWFEFHRRVPPHAGLDASDIWATRGYIDKHLYVGLVRLAFAYAFAEHNCYFHRL